MTRILYIFGLKSNSLSISYLLFLVIGQPPLLPQNLFACGGGFYGGARVLMTKSTSPGRRKVFLKGGRMRE